MRIYVSRVVVVLASVTLLAAACSKGDGSSSGESNEGGKIKIGSDRANDHGTKSVAGKSELEVEQDEFYFEPTIIEGQAGQKVRLELKNEGKSLHNFSIDSQSVDQDVNSDSSATVTVTIPPSGIVEFYCKYHRTRGMVGELKVA
jgi:plastocyanin